MRLFTRLRLVNGRFQVFKRVPRSNVPMYALFRFKGLTRAQVKAMFR